LFDKFSTGNFYFREWGTGNREQGTGEWEDWEIGNRKEWRTHKKQ
jgi:hypothetical protein